MFQDKNIPFACDNQIITIGRMKGNISPGDRIFKVSNRVLSDETRFTYSGKEIKKVKLNCKITVKNGTPISVFVKPDKEYEHYKNVSVTLNSKVIPIEAINSPITKERIINQFSKTSDTPFEFSKIDIDLDENLYIPKISALNSIRREVLSKLEELVCLKFTRVPIQVKPKTFEEKPHGDIKLSLYLTVLNDTYDYSKLENVDRVYIPLKYFASAKYKTCIKDINNKFDTYIYMPSILTPNYSNIYGNIVNEALENYNISGFVSSNVSALFDMKKNEYKKYDFIVGYGMNIFNDYSINELSRIGVDTVTLSPELNKSDILKIHSNIDKELIVYGRLKLMSTKYCFLGESNLCYPTCKVRCKLDSKYYLKDRMGFKFRVIPDNSQTVTSIYNSKILSIDFKDLNIDYARVDILDENISEINHVINTIRNKKHFKGQDYTSGHISRNV